MHSVRTCHHYRRAFSLVELSIVLVILGLLVGGILGGKSLIRAAELRALLTDREQWVTATQSFKDKYFALPGDMPNATAVWGMAAAGTSCPSTNIDYIKTCDGDGDGIISGYAVGPSGTQSDERARFWQHLSNAGLISGKYSGSGSKGSGKYSKAWVTEDSGTISGSAAWFDGDYNHIFRTNDITNMTPQEMWNIDTKIDDGKPAMGKMVVLAATVGTCSDATSSANLTAQYLLTVDTKVCGPVFRNQF